MYTVIYESRVVKEDIKKLSTKAKTAIKKAISEKLTTDPDLFGKPLRKSLRKYWRLRVGDYRVVYRIEEKTVIIFAIQHRSKIYK